MNTSSPYDQLMAAKLDQVPVPDMADSIWSAIDTQLDAAPDAPKKKTFRKFNGKGWYGMLGTVTVVTLLWWGYKHINHTPPQNKPPQKIQPVTKDSSAAVEDTASTINTVKKRNIPVKPVTVKKDSIGLQNIPLNSTVVDSIAKQHLPPIRIDSPLHINSVPLPRFDSVRTNPPPGQKKGKGVRINNDDYKISAGKDSGG